MPVRVPYYNLHQIQTGLYSSGNEFVLNDGSIYVGLYHILPTNQKFSEAQPNSRSVELFELRLNPSALVLKYNQITGRTVSKYITPISFNPIPNLDDYKRGQLERFFIQKRNSPQNTTMEIDYLQYNSVNMQNRPGINGVLWNKLKIDWIISKIPIDDAKFINRRKLQLAEVNFPGIGIYITNTLEFYR